MYDNSYLVSQRVTCKLIIDLRAQESIMHFAILRVEQNIKIPIMPEFILIFCNILRDRGQIYILLIKVLI